MRKIEKAMVAHLLCGERYFNDNTEVRPIDGTSYVYLHGNLIAQYDKYGLMVSLAGWNTPTTRSRLTALVRGIADAHSFGDAESIVAPEGLGVGTRKGTPYLFDSRGMVEIDEHGWHPVQLEVRHVGRN